MPMPKILIVGLPFFPKKYEYAVSSYHNLDYEVKVLINAPRTTTYSVFPYVEFSGGGKLDRVISFFKLIRDFRPDNIDCYNYSVFSIFYVLSARLLGVNVRFWVIGGELKGGVENFNTDSILTKSYAKIKKFLTWGCVRFANAIFAKELHHLKSIESKCPIALSKTVQIHNCVPEVDYDEEGRLKAKHDFLYANAVIESRNVVSLLYAFNELKGSKLTFSASVYGFNSIANEVYAPRGHSYSAQALEVYEKLNVASHVTVHGFIKDISGIMKNFKFFVFPADVVLANYALLEAMSYGLVPIVYPGDGYEEIIVDGVNGFVAHDFNLVPVFERALLLSEQEYLQMSREANRTIIERFSVSIWENKLSLHLI